VITGSSNRPLIPRVYPAKVVGDIQMVRKNGQRR
jgi:hypothetical protein